MISQWWSFTLVSIGVAGLILVYRYPRSLIGPAVGLAVQLLWIAYAIDTAQWSFLGSAFAYGLANIYGIRTRRQARDSVTVHAPIVMKASAEQHAKVSRVRLKGFPR
ncbi:hypothetical protein IU501_34785 [Nocardia otitidiscaviarum]|uniref:hypothetical protein n=1 Tax=Nocardia otitidiscaviarum TaxID=1823 RepID=UPI001895B53D|nr:hypothetical protein [Nocardia otitidiscaviarum]MBF6138138.1 hypothetical protein [Nocardia otitidiscaviarum]